MSSEGRSAPKSGVQLQAGSWSVELAKDGTFRKLSGPGASLFSSKRALARPSILEHGRLTPCVCRLRASGKNAAEWVAECAAPTLSKPILMQYRVAARTTGRQELTLELSYKVLESPAGWGQAEILLPVPFSLTDSRAVFFLPLQSGRLARPLARDGLDHVLTISGPLESGPRQRLAIPVVGADTGDELAQVTVTWDPYVTGRLRLGREARSAGGDHLATPYTEVLGSLVGEERSLWCVLDAGQGREHLDVLSRTALADVPAGPRWLHEIDLVGYDYFSHGGKGWYADLQTLSEWFKPSERHRVAVTLHGWFGLCGHYAYDRAKQDLLKEWTVFPGWQAVKDKFPNNVPVKVNVREIRARLGHARKLGFRCLLYFADGTNACTAAGWRADNQRATAGRAWTGPDTMGESLLLNPVHPEVTQWYEGYLNALLRHFGDLIHGLVWDETFYVRSGDHGATGCPGYSARAMMHLVKRLTDIVHDHSPHVAFLTSDCIGASERCLEVPPYAMVADGCYQDSGCEPQAWPYGLFPTYRNVLWSCNWWPITQFARTRHAVEVFGVPAVFTNGFQDDRFLRDYPVEVQRGLQQLFELGRTMPRVRWIEEGTSRQVSSHETL